MHSLIRRWNIATERNGDCVEKKGFDPLTFVMMYDTCSCVGNYSCIIENLLVRKCINIKKKHVLRGLFYL